MNAAQKNSERYFQAQNSYPLMLSAVISAKRSEEQGNSTTALVLVS